MSARISNSPWGHVDQQRDVAPGLAWVSTPSHGGLWLSPERWAMLRAALPGAGSYAPDGWLEEDLDWAQAAIVFPEAFTARECFYAVDTARGYPRDGVSGDYMRVPREYLDTPAGARVVAKAAQFTPEPRNV